MSDSRRKGRVNCLLFTYPRSVYTDAATLIYPMYCMSLHDLYLTPIPFCPWSLSLLQRRRITSLGDSIIWQRNHNFTVAGNREYKETVSTNSVQSSSKSRPLWVTLNQEKIMLAKKNMLVTSSNPLRQASLLQQNL